MPLVFPEPPLSTAFAHLLTFLFTSTYVGSLYLSKNARLSFSSNVAPARYDQPRRKENNERWRDDPDVIKARLLAVSLATAACCAGFIGIVWKLVGNGQNTFPVALETALPRLGIHLDFTRDIRSIYPHLITPLLFLGPLYSRYLLQCLPFQRNLSFKHDVVTTFISWQGARNYLVGPVTEEIVFRACILAVYHLSGASNTRMILFAPLSFGAAHIHHAWDTYSRYGRTSAALKRAIITSLFQLAYTTLFGSHCAFLFLRTGSLLPPISAHIWCNVMGVPQIGWEMERFRRKQNAILMAYALGIVLFFYTLGPWTRTPTSLYWRAGGADVGASEGSRRTY